MSFALFFSLFLFFLIDECVKELAEWLQGEMMARDQVVRGKYGGIWEHFLAVVVYFVVGGLRKFWTHWLCVFYWVLSLPLLLFRISQCFTLFYFIYLLIFLFYWLFFQLNLLEYVKKITLFQYSDKKEGMSNYDKYIN